MEIPEAIIDDLKSTLEELDSAVEEGNLFRIKSVLNSMQAPDISDFLETLDDAEQMATLFRLLKKELAIDVFEHLEFEEQEHLLSNLKRERVIEILEEMDPDDRTELFEEMPAKIVKKYLSHLSPAERMVATKLLGYPDDSVGRLMTTDYVAFRPNITAAEALVKLKEMALDKETIYHCYIIDSTRKLIGYCSLKMILLAEPEQLLSEVMIADVISLDARQDQEAAARLHKHYDLLALPVVDSEERLVGIVTFDDLVDVIEEETTEDVHKMAAIVPEEHPYFDSGFFTLAGKRILWLMVLLIAESFSGNIMQHYATALESAVGLAFFIPLLIATGGNAGTQSSAMIIRSLAVGEIRVNQFARVIFREMRMGFVLGLGLCVIGYLRAYLLNANHSMALVVGIALTITVICATLAGSALPLLFRAIKLDPALMSGPFISTVVDIIGLLIYFETARMLLPG
ncbi:MAG TPA: magnesium transporter [Acidobacteriota bacterium]|nr:magnesium transporter [Acidobacteriota bacterium]